MHVFIDESGDLGFSSKASNFFVAAYVVPENPWVIRRRLKRLLGRLHKRRRYSGSELKFSNSNNRVRLHVLGKCQEMEWIAGLIILEKRKVKPELREIPNQLYNYLIVNYLMKRVLQWLDPLDRLILCIDRSLSKSNREAFDTYVRDKASWVWNVELERKSPLIKNQITISHDRSQDECCLQLADYVAGAAFQKYERNRDDYFSLLGDKVAAFNYLW